MTKIKDFNFEIDEDDINYLSSRDFSKTKKKIKKSSSKFTKKSKLRD